MSKQKKNNYKIFPINTIENALIALGELIMSLKVDLEKYIEYHSELKIIIKQYSEINENQTEIISHKPIPEKVFNDLNDKVQYRQMNMLKVISDEQNNSFSYKNLRKILMKQKFINYHLPEEINKVLNEFLVIRNWSFHNPQSLISASREVADKSIPDELKSSVKFQPQLHHVHAFTYNYYDISYLLSLDIHMETRISKTNELIDYMIKDYEEMYYSLKPQGVTFTFGGGEVLDSTKVHFRIYRKEKPKELTDNIGKIVQISAAIQKGKYDGTKEVYDKWTLTDIKSREY